MPRARTTHDTRPTRWPTTRYRGREFPVLAAGLRVCHDPRRALAFVKVPLAVVDRFSDDGVPVLLRDADGAIVPLRVANTKTGREEITFRRIDLGPWDGEPDRAPNETIRAAREITDEVSECEGFLPAEDAPPALTAATEAPVVLTVEDVWTAFKEDRRDYYPRSKDFSKKRNELDNLRDAFEWPRMLFAGQDVRTLSDHDFEHLQDVLANGYRTRTGTLKQLTRFMDKKKNERNGGKKERTTHAGYSRQHTNATMRRIKTVFRWAKKKRLVPEEVCASVCGVDAVLAGRTALAERPKVECANEDDVRRVFTAQREFMAHDGSVLRTGPWLNDEVRLVILFGLFAGTRPDEACKLRTSEIDREGPVWIFRPKEHKNASRGKLRAIPIWSALRPIVDPLLNDDDPEAYCLRPSRAKHRHLLADREALNERRSKQGKPPLTTTIGMPEGRVRRYSANSVGQAITKACAALDVPKFSLQQLRHNGLTRARRLGGVELAAIVASHSVPGFGMTEHYADLPLDRLVDADPLISAEITAWLGRGVEERSVVGKVG